MKSLHFFTFLLALCLIGFTGCDGEKKTGHDHPDHDHDAHHGHAHTAPHGGTLVLLGDHQYHLELIQDKTTGRITAYVLDGEAEKFIRIAQPDLKLMMVVEGKPVGILLGAVANSATGEKNGDTSCFGGQADWLKTVDSFEVTIEKIDIRGTVFSDVKFPFPKGNHS